MDSIQGLHVMTLANSIIGVSILAMPYCFKQCGIILSILLLLFSSVLSRLSCHFLIKSAIKAKLKTFENLAFHAFGPLGKFAVEIGLIGFLIGTCIAFFVVMGDLGPQIVAQLSETSATSQLRTLILVSLAVFCVLPLGLLRNVESLTGVCTATIGFYACLVLKIISESAPHIASGDWIGNVDYWKPSGILQCIPIFSMALFCQTQLFEIYQTMSNASLDKMNAVVRIATHICTCVYIFVGVFGYIAVSGHGAPFGGNILLAFKPSLITEIIKIGFVLSVAFSFPLVIFPCRASIYSLLYKSSYSLLDTNSINGSSSTTSHAAAPTIYIPENKFRSITILIVATSLFIGIIIPNIELVLGLVGSTIGVMICVIFPATTFICLTTKNTNERIGAQLMLCTGILVMVLGSYANFYAIEEVAINPMDAVKPIQIENVPAIDSAIESFEEKHKIEIAKLDVEHVINEFKLEEINKNIVKDEVKENKVDFIEEIGKILDTKDESLNEIRHEPVQPEEPIEEPKKDEEDKGEVKKEPEEIAKNKSAEKVNVTIERNEVGVAPKLRNSEEKIKLDTNIDVEAIKKEDAEVLEQKKKEIIQETKKNAEILENLQKQNEFQQEIVQEQKKILGELQELKKIALGETTKEKQQSKIESNDDTNKLNNSAKILEHTRINEAAQVINEIDQNISRDGKIVGNKVGNNQEDKFVIAENNLAENKRAKDERAINFKPEISNEIGNNSKKPIQDAVLKMLENQMEENNKRDNKSKNSGEQINSLVETNLEKVNNTENNKEIVIKDNDKMDSSKENVNSMRRDILSADETIIRVKRDTNNELKNEESQEQCNNSSNIVNKDDQTRYEGKFLARELKSVKLDSENDP